MSRNALTSEKKNVPTSCRAALQWPLRPATNTQKRLIWLQPESNRALQQQRLQHWGAGGFSLVTRTIPGILCQVCGKPVVSVKTSFPFVSIGCFTGHVLHLFKRQNKMGSGNGVSIGRTMCEANAVPKLSCGSSGKKVVRVCMGLHLLLCVFS